MLFSRMPPHCAPNFTDPPIYDSDEESSAAAFWNGSHYFNGTNLPEAGDDYYTYIDPQVKYTNQLFKETLTISAQIGCIVAYPTRFH